MPKGGASRGKGRGVKWIREHLNHKGEECLPWPFGKDDKGYGICGFEGKVYKASRLMCIFKHGPPPTGRHQAAHSCGNGHLACTHPEHVFWRTPQENRLESNEHGTGNPPAPRRLTIEDVQAIRRMQGSKSTYEIAPLFGVHPDTIGKIFRGETWTNPRCKLTKDQIARIRSCTDPALPLARELGLSHAQVYRIRAGTTHQGIK